MLQTLPRSQPHRHAGTTELSRATRRDPDIAVLIPCYNEELAVARVVADFHASLPDATVHVYDNNSSDRTRSRRPRRRRRRARETLQGKGHVVRRMFADVEADIYVLVDGDDTYDAAAPHRHGAHADRATSSTW